MADPRAQLERVEALQWRAGRIIPVERISLVANYRTQLNTIIQKSSYQELVKTMRARRDTPSATAGVARPGEPAVEVPRPAGPRQAP